MKDPKLNKKVFDFIDLKNKKNEYKYWLDKAPDDRILAIEMLRKINYGYDLATERLQRIFEFAELA